MPGLIIVTASDLERWSQSITARTDLPGLIADLIRASCPTLQSYRFPRGDASQTHGFDGTTDVDVEHVTFVPAGRCVWEFGTGANYEAKASDDFTKRTAELAAEERAMHSFTFVTSRIWHGGPEAWERERASAGWRLVRVIDATQLESWVSECPAVSIPLAKSLGIYPPANVRTLTDFWDDYRLNFNPVLREELLLTGREKRASELCQALAEGINGLSKWQADSASEAIAFIAASILKADSETSAFLLSKSLVIENREVAQILPTTNRFHFVLTPASARAGSGLARRSQVTLALGSDDRASDAQVLERMNTRDFAAGLRSMGFEEEEAFRLATQCGRSVTVLSRLRYSTVAVRPEWHRELALIPLILGGSWDARNEHDCAAMAKLCNSSYEQVEIVARRFAVLADPPLDLEGTVWSLRSPTDAFILLGNLIDTAMQGRLREVCIEVLGERDLTQDVPDDQKPIIPTRGEDFRHSEWIRRGLARTLLLIAGLYDAAGFTVIGGNPEDFVSEVVASLPRLREDVKLLASLKSELPLLTEAAPVPLASALEHVLEGDSSTWAPVIFRDSKQNSLFGSFSPHTYLLWGLETMAWSPQYLHRAASLLMKLAENDPGGSLTNRPLDSLRRIFLAWMPNTHASLDERLAVCRAVCTASVKKGLELAMSLMPTFHDHAHATAKPRLRSFGDIQEQSVTRGEMNAAYREYTYLAVDLAGQDGAALTKLVPALPEIDPEVRGRVLDSIKAAAKTAEPKVAFELWSALRSLVQKHSSFQEADWALSQDELQPMEEVVREIEPRDPVERIVWLFNDYSPKGGMPKGQDYMEEANRDRREAVRELKQQGVSTVLKLAREATLPHFVGIAVGEESESPEEAEQVLVAALNEEGLTLEFAVALSAVAHFRFDGAWDSWLVRFAAGRDPVTVASLFLRWPDALSTWNVVSQVSSEVELEYWHRKWAFRLATPDEFRIAFDKYVRIGRFSAILDMIAYDESLLTTKECILVLEGLIGELNADPSKLQHVHHAVMEMIKELEQRQDANLDEVAALEYQYFPILEYQAEPVALNRVLATSPAMFIQLICDAFTPASGLNEAVTDERRARAGLAFRLLRAMKTVPGISPESIDETQLKWWVSEVRRLAKEADRAIIADQQIGQVLAFAPADTEDGAWPAKEVRDLIEELADEEVERGIAISRFNQRGAHSRGLFDGGAQERALANQYRDWAGASVRWSRTSRLLKGIAEDWERHARMMDTETRLDQLRDS